MILLNERIEFHMKNNHCVNVSHTDSTTTKNVYILSYDYSGIMVSKRSPNMPSDFREIAFISMSYVGGIIPDHYSNPNHDQDGYEKEFIVEEEI